MSQNVHFVSDITKLLELKYKKKPIIAEFYTDWCPPCKPARALIEKQLKEEGKFVLACVNCDQAEELNIEYQIDGVPTIVALNNDDRQTVFDKVIGYDPKKIKQLIERVRKESFEIKK